jgi:subtilisin family serine protease
MRKSDLIRTGLITITILLIISAKSSTGTSIPNLTRNFQYKTSTTENVRSLINEFRISPKLEKENQYLIFFDKTSEFNDFLGRYPVKMVFRGLEGVIIQTTPLMVSKLIKEFTFITENNIHRISNTPRRLVSHTDTISTPSVTQKIQSVSSAQAIGIDRLWNLGYKGQGTTIGIFDMGVNQSHPDFSFENGTSRVKHVEGFVNTTYGNSADREPTAGYHGTEVAGCAAGGGIQNPSYIGMAPEAWLLDADIDESHTSSDLDMTILAEIAAINWAIESGVDIINRSYGPDDPEEAFWAKRLDPWEQVMAATVRQGIKKGVIFTQSAGNSGGSGISGYTMDCMSLIDEITVGATNDYYEYIASFSNTGPIWGTNAIGPDVVAPGTNIPTTRVSGGYTTSSGTSYSAPHVAGAAAVLLGAMHDNVIDVNPGSIKAALMATTNNPWEEPFIYGTGQINASAAYDYLMDAPRIGNHAIVTATNPKNITSWVLGNYPFQKALIGSENLLHFTFVSSESRNVSMSVTGSISSFINLKEVLLENFSSGLRYNDVYLEDGKLSDQYSHHLILETQIPEGTQPGYYNGSLVFKVNNTIIKEIPYSFNVENAEKKILFYTGASSDFTHNTLFGQFVNLQFNLSEQGIVLNEYKGYISTDILTDYDLLWLASCNQSYTGFLYEPQADVITRVERERVINVTMQNTINQFVRNGGGLIVTPYSNPVGIENVINSWGITTKELDLTGTGGEGIMSSFGPIGSTAEDYFDFSGPIFSTEVPAVPLAYFNSRDNVVMASYDDPYGGRVVVVSGSDFITNDKLQSNSNPLIVNDIINWLDFDHQLFGTYEIAENIATISLHASTNHLQNNAGGIVGSYTNPITNTVIDITDEIPTSGTNGWYNFTYTIEPESIALLNFSWNSDFVVFELISDNNPPIIGLSGIANNSHLIRLTEIYFWFDDSGSGINRFNAEMTLNDEKIGFNTPKENKTGSGFYIMMTLYPEEFETGTYSLKLTVYDIAGNSVSIVLVFIVGGSPDTTKATSGKAGYEFGSIYGIAILGFFIARKVKRKKRS